MPRNTWEAELAGYQQLLQECRLKGLAPEPIEKSRTSLSHSVNGIQYLKKEAFLPTGLALGCPLDDGDLTRSLADLSHQATSYLSEVSKSREPTVAFVPAESYHITVLNRTYFESSSQVFPLSEKELQSAEETIRKLGIGCITIDARGLVLTSSGKILVCGYPSSDNLDKLRQKVAKSVQILESGKLVQPLNNNIPKGATIKLGHLLIPLSKLELGLFMDWLDRAGKDISHQLVFTDLYTQIRRVLL